MMSDKIVLYALEVVQEFQKFYSVKIKASLLRELCYTKHAEKTDGNLDGIQRTFNKQRLVDIGKFIDSKDAAFPNPIIVSANYDSKDRMADEDKKWRVEAVEPKQGLYKLIIPTREELCSIIDGQHRLFAFDYAKTENQNMDLMCSVYLDMPPAYQAFMFSTINLNQTKVNKSLAYHLFGYRLDTDNQKMWVPDTLAIYIARLLDKEFLPLKGRIIYRTKQEKMTKDWSLSTAVIVEGVISLISKNPRNDRYTINSRDADGLRGRTVLNDDPSLPLRSHYIQGNDKAILQVIQGYFLAVEALFWKEDQISAGTIMNKTVGVLALFEYLKEALCRNGVSQKTVDSFTPLFEKVSEIDFTNTDFFTPNSKGKGRIRNVLSIVSGFKSISDITNDKDEIERYKSILGEAS
ncbi:DGQHR domain-containing protein [Neptuniibacter sp. PT8_73]|uniref:DGQHR domain-containing protein n=1 Tax=Neptuniibacter sp. PT8_73 TaxID=3398206 RepID=UPI0039F5D739